jgi:hypothetical protein
VEAVTTAPVKRCGLHRGGSAALGSPENQRLQKQSGVATSSDKAEEQDENMAPAQNDLVRVDLSQKLQQSHEDRNFMSTQQDTPQGLNGIAATGLFERPAGIVPVCAQRSGVGSTPAFCNHAAAPELLTPTAPLSTADLAAAQVCKDAAGAFLLQWPGSGGNDMDLSHAEPGISNMCNKMRMRV